VIPLRFLFAILVLAAANRAICAPALSPYRLPAEFERQRAIVLGCHELVDQVPELLAEIVAQVRSHVEVIALVNEVAECQRVQAALVARGLPPRGVHFAEVPHDTMWCRDYGPILRANQNGEVTAVDARYVHEARHQDDEVPRALSRQLQLAVVDTPLQVDGGNLLSNGQGLCVTTRRLLQANPALDSERELLATLRRSFGIEQLVVLEPLAGEPTGHADMFATFVSPQTIVVAECDPHDDASNAAILARNAERLARVRTANGPLRVVRVPLPRHDRQTWPSYTNVLYANGVLLVPIYPSVDPQGGNRAVAVFRAELPAWKVVAIDATRLAELGGALHCVTLNLGPLKHIPRFAPPSRLLDDPQSIAATLRGTRWSWPGERLLSGAEVN
jgi:agmatine/peptidylarginine deiminase